MNAIPKAELAVVELMAMSLEMPETGTKLNRHQFSGILTRIDEPSDSPPGGSGNRRVLVTKACAEKSIPTLLGMGVDCRDDFKDHEPANKIGVITSAVIEGNAIVIGGHFFSKDFPQTMAKILREKDKLGFSYELTPTDAAVTADNLLQIDDGIFTGAALLYKSKAAYKSTSLAASDTQEKEKMDLTELAAAVAALTASQTTLVESIKKISETQASQIAASGGDLSASMATRAAVEPHAAAVEACASGMEAAGMGGHPTMGHVAELRRMAGHLRASAAMGKMPHIFRDHDLLSSDATRTAAAVAAADPATKSALDGITAAMTTLKDSLASVTTQLADLKAGGTKTKTDDTNPTRKTIPATAISLLARAGITPESDDPSKINLIDLGTKLKAAGMEPEQIMIVKNTIDRAAKGMAP